MKLWIANCTKQNKEVPYRLPEVRRIFELKISAGQQACLPHEDLSKTQIDYFINQLKHYGLRDANTVKNVREHVGLIYSIDKPVDMNRVAKVRERNDEIMTDVVDESLKQSLLAADHSVRSQTGDHGRVDTVEVLESVPANEDRMAFIRNIMGIPDAALPDDSPYILYSLTGAVNVVNLAIQQISPFLYDIAVNNLAGDNLINWAQDAPDSTFFKDLRASFGCNNFSAGVVQSATDNSTAMTALVPEFFKELTMRDLRNLKTPYGREYLAIAMDYGPLWGLTK